MSKRTKVNIVFVHGFLGSSEDWSQVISQLPSWAEGHCIDLPGHGKKQDLEPKSLDDFAAYLLSELKPLAKSKRPLVLVGYSLGARVLMYSLTPQVCASLNIRKLVVEGGNFGLLRRSDRETRWHNDSAWIERFTHDPIAEVLEGWYRQPVFSHLTQTQRAKLVEERSHNSGAALAKVMRASSLAKQPYLMPRLEGLPMAFVVGEKDTKFRHLYREFGLKYHLVEDAGHNAHKEQSQKFITVLTQILSDELDSSLKT